VTNRKRRDKEYNADITYGGTQSQDMTFMSSIDPEGSMSQFPPLKVRRVVVVVVVC